MRPHVAFRCPDTRELQAEGVPLESHTLFVSAKHKADLAILSGLRLVGPEAHCGRAGQVRVELRQLGHAILIAKDRRQKSVEKGPSRCRPHVDVTGGGLFAELDTPVRQ